MQEFINWTAVSHHLGGGRTAIRKNYHPKKHKEKIELLLHYVDCWEKGIRLESMDVLKDKVKESVDKM